MKNKTICQSARASLVILASLLMMCTSMLITASPVSAQAQADDLIIEDAWCFRHLIEDNDLLVVVHYDIEYASLPDENADELYMLRMFESGTQVAVDLPYPYGDQKGFNEGVGGFYWSASGSQPAWGGAHDIVLQGNPTVWGDVESWKETLMLGDANWSPYDTQSENQLWLYLTILAVAESIETDWGTTMVVSGTLGDVLNDTGSTYFSRAIPALQLMCPEVFSVYESWPNWPSNTWTRDYAEDIRDTVENTPIGDLVEVLQRNLNTTYIAAGSILTFIIFAIVVFLTYSKAKGQGDEGILVGLPVLLMSVRLGLLPMAAWAIFALFCLMLVGYVLFFRHG